VGHLFAVCNISSKKLPCSTDYSHVQPIQNVQLYNAKSLNIPCLSCISDTINCIHVIIRRCCQLFAEEHPINYCAHIYSAACFTHTHTRSCRHTNTHTHSTCTHTGTHALTQVHIHPHRYTCTHTNRNTHNTHNVYEK